MNEEMQEIIHPSLVAEVFRYFTCAFITASCLMCLDIFKYVRNASEISRREATSLESTILALLLSFSGWAIIFVINGVWLSIRKQKLGLMRVGVGMAEVALTSIVAVFKHCSIAIK